MEHESKVGVKALQYRLATKELVSLILTIILSVAAGFALYYFQISNAIPITFGVFGILLLLQLVFIIFPTFLEYSNLKYSIEENSISLQKGVFTVDTETIPFQKIKNASFEQSFFQRMFGVGDITLDQDTEKFTWMSVDKKTASTIMEAVSAKSNIQPIAVSQVQFQNPNQTQ